MRNLTGLRPLFIIIAGVEAIYAALALLTPPSLILPVTGWVLSPDGQWAVKLLGASLGFQAVIAWMFRKDPPVGVAWALAGYQFAAATIDWIIWIVLADQGVFSTAVAQFTVGASVVLHYGLGILLVIAIRRDGTRI